MPLGQSFQTHTAKIFQFDLPYLCIQTPELDSPGCPWESVRTYQGHAACGHRRGVQHPKLRGLGQRDGAMRSQGWPLQVNEVIPGRCRRTPANAWWLPIAPRALFAGIFPVRDVRQKGQLVIAGADVVVLVVYHCTLHWPHTYTQHV